MNNTTPSGYFEDPDDTTIGSFGYGLGLSVAVLIVFVVITFISYKCKNSQSQQSTAVRARRSSADYGDGSIHVVIHHRGLDAATISSFPQYTYAQLKPHKTAAAAACAVCLGDYKDTETLRLLPECGHVFHRSCIDPWLMIHPTCPICRNSPLPTPAETPLQQPAAPVASQ